MAKTARKMVLRRRRRRRIRGGLVGTSERPRVAVFRSARHIYAQAIDDANGTTLFTATSQTSDLPELPEGTEIAGKRAVAYKVGLALAGKAKEAGVGRVIFDRGGFLYHGRVQSLAEGARSGGLDF